MRVFEPGSLIGKYEIVRFVGGGGMGLLYEARHPVLASRLVLKTLRPTLGNAAEMAERFRNEALAASRLRDDRLPQIFDIDTLDDGTQYLVMELLDGEDVAARLHRGPFEPGYAARVVLEVLEVLAKVHRLGIVHRDIKPANIFLARSDLLGEIPKLLDFGVAHIAAIERSRTESVVGTPAYMAPEQAFGGEMGPWTDIFAAGVMLFELVAGEGRRPWAAASPQAYYVALHKKDPPRALEDVVPRAPAGLGEAIARALAHEPTGRYRDATAFVRALEPFAIPRAALDGAGRAHVAAFARARSGGLTGDQSALETLGPSTETLAPDAATEVTQLTAAGSPSGPTLLAPVSEAPPAPSEAAPGTAAPRPLSAQRVAGLRAQLDRFKQGAAMLPAAARVSDPGLQAGEQRPVALVYVELQLRSAGEAHLGAEDLDALERQLHEMITAELERRGAHVDVQPDGGLLALFGYHHIHEDDAEVAATAALAAGHRRVDASRLLADVGFMLLSRTGVHSGFATRLEGAGASLPLTGDAIRVVRGLAAHAPINGVLASAEAVEQLGELFPTRPVGRLTLEGRGEPVDAHELLGTDAAQWTAGTPGARTSRRGGRASLVGRAAELAQLEATVARLRNGPEGPLLVLVTGGAGTGKTRLVSELLERLGRQGARGAPVTRVFPPPREPYGLWASVLQALLGVGQGGPPDDDQLDRALGPLGAALDPDRRAALLLERGVIAMLLGGGTADLADHSPRALGSRIQNAVALCLEGAARRAAPWAGDPPLVVALENMHRADDASLALVGRVLRALRPTTPLLLLVTAREGPALDLHDAAGCVRVALGPLGEGETLELLRALSAAAPLSPAACAFVAGRAGGNPLFIEELVGTLLDHGLAGASAEHLRGFTPPTSLHALLLERVDRLEPQLREMLRVASVLGTEFERPLFAAVVEAAAAHIPALASGRSPLDGLDALVQCDVLARRDQADGAELDSFQQAQTQGAVYGTILTENKRALHRLAAEAIERLHEGHVDRHRSRLLHHWSQTEDLERTVYYARTAGQKAFGVGAYDEASEDLMMAAALQDQLREVDPLPGARTLLDLARSYVWSGRIFQAGAPAAEASTRLPRAVASALPEARRAEALALRGHISMTQAQLADLGARPDATIDHFADAEHAFAEAGLAADAALARCSRGFALRSAGRPAEGVELARDGWDVLKASGNLAAIAKAGHDLGNVLRDLGQYQAALQLFDAAVAAGDELRRRGNILEATWGALAARSGRGMTHAAMGDTNAAIADQRAAFELAIRDGNLIAQVFSQYHLAAHLFDRDELDEAERVAEAGYQLSVETGMMSRALKCRLFLARIAERRHDPGRAIGHLEEAEALARRELLPDEVWVDVAEKLVAALRAAGRGAQAEGIVGEAEGRAERSGSARLRERAGGLRGAVSVAETAGQRSKTRT